MAEPTREQVDQLPGAVVLEFGAGWCPYCQDIQAPLGAALQQYPHVRHIAIEDGKGRRLGRSFGVKLWPTLVFMQDGRIVHKAVRPSRSEMERGFAELKQETSITQMP
jgi:thioredoxin 1